MRALALGLTLAALACPALAGEAEEQQLYHWGQCAAVGAIYEAAVEDSGADPGIQVSVDNYHELELRMETHTNALADAVGKDRADAIQGALLASFDSDIALWAESEDPDGFMIATWGETMDRCLREAATLPAAAPPKT